MYKSALIFIALVLFTRTFSLDHRDIIIFWNVGQGSWTSLITSDMCLHIDTGGRHRPLTQQCYQRKNFLWFTHYDWDHISQARKIFAAAPNTCLMQVPPLDLKEFKKKFLSTIPICKRSSTQRLHIAHKSHFSKKNESTVFVLAHRVLITGDATQKMERQWLHKIPANVQILVAGHHGSRTSLSPLLLKKLTQLRMVIVSAQKKMYGHPHRETIDKLRGARLPMVKTEDYGSIAVELPF